MIPKVAPTVAQITAEKIQKMQGNQKSRFSLLFLSHFSGPSFPTLLLLLLQLFTNDVDFYLLIDQIVINYCNEEMLKGIQPIISFNTFPSPLLHISHLCSEGIGIICRIHSSSTILEFQQFICFTVRIPEVPFQLSVCEALLSRDMFCFKKTQVSYFLLTICSDIPSFLEIPFQTCK